MATTFTPPTTFERSSDHFFGRFRGVEVGQSVLRRNGAFATVPYPWLGELIGKEGEDWFLGGRTYTVTDAIAAELENAGYTVNAPGYGHGAYGRGAYGA